MIFDFCFCKDFYWTSANASTEQHLIVPAKIFPGVDSPSVSYVSGQVTFDPYLVDYNNLVGEEFQDNGKMVYNFNNNSLRISADSPDNIACERPLKNLYCIVLDELAAKVELGSLQDFVANTAKGSSTSSSDCIQSCKGKLSRVKKYLLKLTKANIAFNSTQ